MTEQAPSLNALPRGTIKNAPEDFVVDEIPAYAPSGEGAHLFVRFRKRNLTTDDAVRALARALGVERRDIGVPGMKDKAAVTTQWISVPASPSALERIERIGQNEPATLEGIEILEHRRHGNKLKTGHLDGNEFRIVVRDLDPAEVDLVLAAFDRLAKEGVPNAFGEQRFGRDADNHDRARSWLTGQTRAPSDPRLRRFHFSAFQSWIFNQILDARISDGTWNIPLLGDLLKKEESGGMFVCTDVQQDRERAARGELWPTGPIVGDKMRQPEADALALENRIVAPLIEGIDLHRARSLGEGTRRPLGFRVAGMSHRRVPPESGANASTNDEALSHETSQENALRRPEQGAAIEVRFVLPRGAYATTVLSNALSFVDAARSEDRGHTKREPHRVTAAEPLETETEEE